MVALGVEADLSDGDGLVLDDEQPSRSIVEHAPQPHDVVVPGRCRMERAPLHLGIGPQCEQELGVVERGRSELHGWRDQIRDRFRHEAGAVPGHGTRAGSGDGFAASVGDGIGDLVHERALISVEHA